MLATQVAPTAVPYGTRQPWLVRPSILRFVTSPYIGYASRPNRAIDGVGTSTPQDSRPCRPLPRRYLCVSVPRCLDLYPGGVVGACTHDFPTPIGLPPVPMRSAPRNNPLGDFRAGVMSELQSFAHVQASRFAATQVAPTAVFAHGAAVAFTSEQNTGRYLPMHRICSPSEWAIDGRRTSTSLDTQPCRLLQGLSPYVFHACTGVPSQYLTRFTLARWARLVFGG